jgi:hypothetical protein
MLGTSEKGMRTVEGTESLATLSTGVWSKKEAGNSD